MSINQEIEYRRWEHRVKRKMLNGKILSAEIDIIQLSMFFVYSLNNQSWRYVLFYPILFHPVHVVPRSNRD